MTLLQDLFDATEGINETMLSFSTVEQLEAILDKHFNLEDLHLTCGKVYLADCAEVYDVAGMNNDVQLSVFKAYDNATVFQMQFMDKQFFFYCNNVDHGFWQEDALDEVREQEFQKEQDYKMKREAIHSYCNLNCSECKIADQCVSVCSTFGYNEDRMKEAVNAAFEIIAGGAK